MILTGPLFASVSDSGDDVFKLNRFILQLNGLQHDRLVSRRMGFKRTWLAGGVAYKPGESGGDDLLALGETHAYIRAVPFPNQLVLTRRELSALQS